MTTSSSNYTHEYEPDGKLAYCSEAVDMLSWGKPGWLTGFGTCPHGVLDEDGCPAFVTLRGPTPTVLTPDETAAYIAAHPEVGARARELAQGLAGQDGVA